MAGNKHILDILLSLLPLRQHYEVVVQKSANNLNPEPLLWSTYSFLVDIEYKILCILQPGGISPWLFETIQTFCYAFNLKLLRHEAQPLSFLVTK